MLINFLAFNDTKEFKMGIKYLTKLPKTSKLYLRI